MASIVEICNSALNQLGASTILALTENSKNGRICNSRYDTVKDAVLRSHPWNCATKRQILAQDTDTPAWGFTYQYTLPSDCLRVLAIQNYDSDYKIEGRKILSNDSEINLIYIATISDPNEMDVLLREVIGSALAADIAYAVTANASISRQMEERYLLKLKDARHADASEGYNTDPTLGNVDQILAEDYLNSRF
jgi:hypothetical protein